MKKPLPFRPLLLLATLLFFVTVCHAGDAIPLSRGQLIYVPAYSHIYAGNREIPLLLTVTLSIRNTDPSHKITLSQVDYYGTKGEPIKKMLDGVVVLGPLESTRYVIPQKDKTGGSGANFLVTWSSDTPVNLPLVEAVMIGAERQQGISFTSRGQAISTAD